VAKTNDGNLLQHFVECQAAERVAQDTRTLHLVCTHAMAPFEPGSCGADEPTAHALHAALGRADASAAAWPLLRAYHATRARADHYPNSAELISTLVGPGGMSGVLCEKDEIAASVLMNRWAGSDVRVRTGSWRNAVAAGVLDVPTPERPWLLSMDPYTWLLGHEADKASRGPRLCKADLELLRPLIGHYARGASPGVAVITVYGLDDAHAADFRRSVIALADRPGLERSFLGLPAGDGRRHLCAVLSPTPGIVAELAEAWARFCAESAAR
jgi:hypothetical protein